MLSDQVQFGFQVAEVPPLPQGAPS
jgi:hypothetical protein